jgi:riboflavin synthase
MWMAWPRSSPPETRATAPASRSARPPGLARFIAPKGSVALNGTSLTVNEVDGAEFGVNIIPHTKEVTTWGALKAGDR